MKQWYEVLFENYSSKYDTEPFTQGTIGECDFLESELSGNKGAQILDVGCGTGRHAIEMAKRGYRVTGIDLSESMLKRAKEKAAEAGVSVDFRQGDARNLDFNNEFDLVIMLCEGAFPLMETDEMNFRILDGAGSALKPGGKMIFTTLNALFPLFHSVKEFMDSNAGDTGTKYDGLSFDLMKFRDHNITGVDDDSGVRRELRCNERYYAPSEISWMLTSLGFRTVNIFGAKLGAFSRQSPLTTEDFEMLVVAEK